MQSATVFARIKEEDEVWNCFSWEYHCSDHLNPMMILEEGKKSLSKQTIMFLAIPFALGTWIFDKFLHFSLQADMKAEEKNQNQSWGYWVALAYLKSTRFTCLSRREGRRCTSLKKRHKYWVLRFTKGSSFEENRKWAEIKLHRPYCI